MTPAASTGGGFDVIYFANLDWNFTWQRPQQLASRFGRHGKVLYVSPLGLRSIGPGDLPRVARRLAFRMANRSAQAAGGALTVHAPLLYLPFAHSRLATRVNARLLRSSLARWMAREHVTAPVMWIGVPTPAIVPALAPLNARCVVYDCIDDVARFHARPSAVAGWERELASRAHVVFATARELYVRMKAINPRTFLMPNAADFAHFSRPPEPASPPPDVAHVKAPVLGYVGGFAPWFDFDAVRGLAAADPAWSIVLIGPIQTDSVRKPLRALRALPNVHYLGFKDYADLPAYVSRFDVCLLPFEVNAVTSAVSPVKLYEYLAAGKPVVSTPLSEVLPFREVVEVADRDGFASAVKRALDTGRDEAGIERRREVARRNTWDHRVEEILRILEPVEATAAAASRAHGSAEPRESASR